MPDPVAPTVVILLASALGLLLLLLALVLGISRRLARLEHRLAAASTSSSEGASAPSPAETSAGGAFEAFLDEEPARRALPKGEQFAQYRRWRQAHGMNWSKS